MKFLGIFFVMYAFFSISQNTWDGSLVSTYTTGGVGIGGSPVSNISLKINNTSRTYGIQNNNSLSSSGTKYGIYNYLTSTSSLGSNYGIYTNVSGSSTSKFGLYTSVNSPGASSGVLEAATSYGLYATASGAFTRAAFFKGDVEFNASNTIYSSSNGNKILFYLNRTGTTPENYSFNMAFNQTNGQFDWDWGTNFILLRSGEMIKRVNTPAKAFSIHRSDFAVDVFRVYGDGKVFATEINVKMANNFPDYVFNTNYKLLSIKELSDYININRRLPNMPSAEVVQQYGLDLGELSRVLVEKVEELTLYIIQQQELIEKQEVRLKELEEKVKQ